MGGIALASDAPGNQVMRGWLLPACGRSTAHIAGLFHPALGKKPEPPDPKKGVQVVTKQGLPLSTAP